MGTLLTVTEPIIYLNVLIYELLKKKKKANVDRWTLEASLHFSIQSNNICSSCLLCDLKKLLL